MVMELIQSYIVEYPRASIMVLAFLITLLITIVNYFMIDRERMKEIRDRQKSLKADLKKFKDNPDKVLEINKKLMEDIPEQLKHSFKPMLVTIIPLLIFFSWLRGSFEVTSIAGTWFWWYLGTAIFSSVILRKIFGLQ